ncbi:MAG: preprotein translocase subunit SecE [Polyangiaceae bacterium]|nr:preprotein translocase subunit SecE [Polyangiaceae bacterium]
MPVQQDVKRKSEGAGGEAGTEHAPKAAEVAEPARSHNGAHAEAGETSERADDEVEVAPDSPSQLGSRRFVYAAYFAGALAIAFLVSKVIELAWLRLQSWKPTVGDPRDEVVLPISGLIGCAVAIYYWRRTRARQLAEEVAAEMGKVTWPSRTEVTNGTVVVIITTLVSTVFFALMDKFWGFVTNLVYGGT